MRRRDICSATKQCVIRRHIYCRAATLQSPMQHCSRISTPDLQTLVLMSYISRFLKAMHGSILTIQGSDYRINPNTPHANALWRFSICVMRTVSIVPASVSKLHGCKWTKETIRTRRCAKRRAFINSFDPTRSSLTREDKQGVH